MIRFLLIVLAFALVQTGCSKKTLERSDLTKGLSCLENDDQLQAERPAGMIGEYSAVIPGGRVVSPVGSSVTVSNWAIAAAYSTDGTEVFITHNGESRLTVLDASSWQKKQEVTGVGGFRGVVARPDALFTADMKHSSVSRLEKVDDVWEVTKSVSLMGVPTFLLYAELTDRLIVLSGLNSRIWEIDPVSLEVLDDYETSGIYAYDMVLDETEEHLFVSHTGDDILEKINRQSKLSIGKLELDMNPMGLALYEDRVFIANSDSDTISVAGTEPFELIQTIDATDPTPGLAGGSPNEIVVDKEGKRLFVSFADLNMVRIWSLTTQEELGAFPTAAYPTGLAVSPDSQNLVVIASKGWAGADSLHNWSSVASRVSLDMDDLLDSWTKIAFFNLLTPSRIFSSEFCKQSVPLPLDQEAEPVINHVVVIVRENKTYDTVLGDLDTGNADPALVVFGEEYTPNIHQMAREFTNLDNYYADSEESVQGHTWTTQADCNDFFEKTYPADPEQFLLYGYDPSTIIGEMSFFDHCFVNGVTFRNYGEFSSFTKNLFGEYEQFLNQKFPYYDLSIPDVRKAGEFVRELELGIFPDFVYIALPNDHTMGGKAGMPTPGSMVADNDEATGIIVDAISHSPFWDSTIVFAIEDDPQGYGGDHVHSHRSLCLVASPWVKRGYVSSVHYSIPSMYRTIELLLRLPPMHKNNALASPMMDIFVEGDAADLMPFDLIPRLYEVEFNQEDGIMAKESEHIVSSSPDGSEGIGEIIWRIMRGDEEPPPYAKWRDK